MPLATKVRWKLGTVLLFLFNIMVTEGSAPKCDKTPRGQDTYKTPGDNGFFVSVAGSPKLYRPGQVYTVSLEGMRTHEGDIEPSRIKFIDFMLVAESNLPATELPNLGTFQLMPGDAMSKFSHKCSHAVQATSALSKDRMKVLWTAPDQGSGCIQLRAMVVERKDIWYMDDGGLTYTICEDDSPLASAPLVEPCCACDEAKYEVIFEGLWSRHTHPKDFPVDEWQTQFSHLIGASHSIDYDLWKYGELSSPALTMLAVTGQTKKLEIDMKRSSKNIRSVIKARGLNQRSNVVGRTFAVFRTDSTNHLLSLVSKIIPSPDWIVGLSLENLCLSNCSWVDSRIIDLYPWDAGINSGVTYQNPGEETMPKEAIHRITSCNPDDERSPFYDPTCAPLKPVARLHILKQREYKKQCPNASGLPLNPSWGTPTAAQINGNGGGEEDIYSGTGIGPTKIEEPGGLDYGSAGSGTYNDYGSSYSSGSSYGGSSSGSSYGGSSSGSYKDSSNPCQVTEWSPWTECSQTCGVGSHSRTRVFTNPIGAQIAACKTDLFEKEKCKGAPCPPVSYRGTYDPFFSEDELAGYNSAWSSRGLSSHNLKKGPDTDSRSYLYSGATNKQVGSSYMYGSSAEPDVSSDPYHDPYNKLAGYAKQKGYPPQTNSPGSSKYNPYKAMGYYGYTYGGPGAGTGNTAYETISSDSMQSLVQGDANSPAACEVTEWGEWSDCSTACGDGTRSRTRYYTEQDTATCSKELYQLDTCQESSACQDSMDGGSTTSRPGGRKKSRPGKALLFNKEDPQCAVAEWTDWSPCSVSCGHGYNIRTRVFTLSFVPNRVCEGVRLTEKKDCRLPSCWNTMDYYDDAQPSFATSTDIDLQEEDVPIIQASSKAKEPFCEEDPDPGPCRMEITRWYYNSKDATCQEFKYSGCGGNRNSFETEEACMDSCHTDSRESTFKSLMSMSLVREDYIHPNNRVVDCQVSEWSLWSACSASCGRGWTSRERQIVVQPQNGGRECPKKLSKRKKCRETLCAPEPASWYKGNWKMLQDENEDA